MFVVRDVGVEGVVGGWVDEEERCAGVEEGFVVFVQVLLGLPAADGVLAGIKGPGGGGVVDGRVPHRAVFEGGAVDLAEFVVSGFASLQVDGEERVAELAHDVLEPGRLGSEVAAL